MEYMPIILSFKLAFITTSILLVLSFIISFLINKTKGIIRILLESILTLPIVLPSSVLGFYLLTLFSKKPLDKFNLLFSFKGLVVASIIYSLPFMLQSINQGLSSINKNLIEASFVSGKGYLETFFRVIIPNMRKYIILGIVITFAHVVGEFGVVLIIGGSIPEKTEVASIAIYNYIENLEYEKASLYSAILVLFSITVLILVNFINRKYDDKS